jgi:hypothetical protein
LLTEAVLMLSAACLIGAVAGLYGQVIIDSYLRHVTGFHAAHHVMTLAGVVAFYTSAPTASSGDAAVVARHVQRELRPLIAPTLAVMRAWRRGKRLRRWWERVARQRRLWPGATR